MIRFIRFHIFVFVSRAKMIRKRLRNRFLLLWRFCSSSLLRNLRSMKNYYWDAKPFSSDFQGLGRYAIEISMTFLSAFPGTSREALSIMSHETRENFSPPPCRVHNWNQHKRNALISHSIEQSSGDYIRNILVDHTIFSAGSFTSVLT
jgi:hypothetical protein